MIRLELGEESHGGAVPLSPPHVNMTEPVMPTLSTWSGGACQSFLGKPLCFPFHRLVLGSWSLSLAHIQGEEDKALPPEGEYLLYMIWNFPIRKIVPCPHLFIQSSIYISVIIQKEENRTWILTLFFGL